MKCVPSQVVLPTARDAAHLALGVMRAAVFIPGRSGDGLVLVHENIHTFARGVVGRDSSIEVTFPVLIYNDVGEGPWSDVIAQARYLTGRLPGQDKVEPCLSSARSQAQGCIAQGSGLPIRFEGTVEADASQNKLEGLLVTLKKLGSNCVLAEYPADKIDAAIEEITQIPAASQFNSTSVTQQASDSQEGRISDRCSDVD